MDNYESLHLVGAGVYGTVSKYKDKVSGDIVAIKQCKYTKQKNDYLRLMAARELSALQRLKHDNIVQYIDSFSHDEKLFIVDRNMLDLIKEMPDGVPVSHIRRLICASHCHAVMVMASYTVISSLRTCHLSGGPLTPAKGILFSKNPTEDEHRGPQSLAEF